MVDMVKDADLARLRGLVDFRREMAAGTDRSVPHSVCLVTTDDVDALDRVLSALTWQPMEADRG